MKNDLPARPMRHSLIDAYSEHPDSQLMRALRDLCIDGKLDAARRAISQGANVDAKLFGDGTTLLMSAALCGYTGQVEALCELGADLEARREDGSTALWCAAVLHGQHYRAIEALLEHGARIDGCGPASADALARLIQMRKDGENDTFKSLDRRIAILEAGKIQAELREISGQSMPGTSKPKKLRV